MGELIGTVLGGRYRIDSKLGSGGQGTVYKAMHLALNMPVAVKLLPASAAQDRTMRTRFVREARRAASLQHPHIVHVFDYAYEEGRYYIVSQFIEGTDLKKMIRASGGPMPMEQTLRYAREVGEALQFAHDRDIIHRDIKPANILIDSQSGRAALCDFGLARMVEGDELEVTSEQGGLPGTPAYMSPEQCQGVKLDHRTDIYSLGLVIYEMLTGRNPFRGDHDTSASIIYKQVNEAPAPLRSLNPGVTRQVEEVLLRALAKAPDQRFPTVTQFINALDAATQGLFKPKEVPAKPRKSLVVPPWIALVVAGVAIIVIFAAVPGPRSLLASQWHKLFGGATAGPVAAATAEPSPISVPSPTAAPGPTKASPTSQPTKAPPPPDEEEVKEGTLGSVFVEDVTVPEGALLRVGEPFVKVWRVRNSGLRPWPPGVHLVHVDGHLMGERDMGEPVPHEVPPGAEIEIELPLVAPHEPGGHHSVWQLGVPDGELFGTKLRVVVEAVFLHDDFGDPDSGWPRQADERRAFVYDGEEYIILVHEPGELYRSLAPTEPMADFVLEVDVELRGEPRPAAFGVVFRHQDVHNSYGFLIRNNGQYGVWKRVDGEAHPIGGPEWTSSPHVRRRGRNRLRVVCRGPQIELFVNGKHLRTVVDETFCDGRIGVCASLGTEEGPIEVAFDNLVVTAP